MAQGRPAKLHFLANGFRVLVPGDHVVCGRSGRPIAIEDLRYWSVARQQAYATPQLSMDAERGA